MDKFKRLAEQRAAYEAEMNGLLETESCLRSRNEWSLGEGRDRGESND